MLLLFSSGPAELLKATKMGDFVQNSNVKSAVRTLANPFPDIATFDALVRLVITSNPFGCIAYTSGSTNHATVEKIRENYTARIVYTDENAKSVGLSNNRYSTVDGFNAGSAAALADTANNTAHRGTPTRDFGSDSYTATIRCHDPNGENYDLSFTRTRITLSS